MQRQLQVVQDCHQDELRDMQRRDHKETQQNRVHDQLQKAEERHQDQLREMQRQLSPVYWITP